MTNYSRSGDTDSDYDDGSDYDYDEETDEDTDDDIDEEVNGPCSPHATCKESDSQNQGSTKKTTFCFEERLFSPRSSRIIRCQVTYKIEFLKGP